MEVERTCSILRETESALRLARIIASCQDHANMVAADDLRSVLSPSDSQAFLTQWRAFFETEHEYNVACREKDPNNESHQNISVLGDKLKYLFRNLFRFVRKHPSLLDKFATDPRLTSELSPAVEQARTLDAYVQHVLERLKAVGESSEVPNLRKRVAGLHTVRQDLKTRDEELRKTSREEGESHAAQVHAATALMQRVGDEIRKASAEAATQRDAVSQVSDEELVRLNEDHAANMTTLQEEINRLKEEHAQELLRHQQDEEAARKKYKLLDKQIELKVKAYDEEMAKLTEKIALVTELHGQESSRLAEMQGRVGALVQERVQYEEAVEKPRLQQQDLERRQALAVKLIQDTYRKFIKNLVIANPPASAAPKKGAKGKAAPAKK